MRVPLLTTNNYNSSSDINCKKPVKKNNMVVFSANLINKKTIASFKKSTNVNIVDKLLVSMREFFVNIASYIENSQSVREASEMAKSIARTSPKSFGAKIAENPVVGFVVDEASITIRNQNPLDSFSKKKSDSKEK